MKKIVFLLMAVMFLSSCVNEFWHGSSKTIGIKVVDIHATKTTVINEPKQKLLFSMPLDIDGLEDCYLEAWISDTESSVATKGTQVDNEKIATPEYGNFRTFAYSGETIYENDDQPLSNIYVKFDGEAWKFKDSTGENDKDYFWPDDGTLTFCSYSPVGSAVDNFRYEDSKVKFKYTSPEHSENNDDARNQADFMVGCDANQSRHENHGDATIHFCHGLTSVKFVNGDIKNLTVKSVTLENFYCSGIAEFNSTPDELGHFEWTPTDSLTSYTQTFNTAFGDDGNNVDGKADFDTSSDQSCTFMVIPQSFKDRGLNKDAKIIIMTNRDIHPVIELNLSKITESSIWTEGLSDEDKKKEAAQLIDWSKYAGKTITFRVGPTVISGVSLEFVGDICDNESGLQIMNTGTEPVYVRASLVVNSENEQYKIINSYIDRNNGIDYENHLVSCGGISSDYWVLNEADGYWYTKSVLRPGDSLPFIYGFDWKRSDGENPDEQDSVSIKDDKGITHIYNNKYLVPSVLVQGVYCDNNNPKIPESWKLL